MFLTKRDLLVTEEQKVLVKFKDFAPQELIINFNPAVLQYINGLLSKYIPDRTSGLPHFVNKENDHYFIAFYEFLACMRNGDYYCPENSINELTHNKVLLTKRDDGKVIIIITEDDLVSFLDFTVQLINFRYQVKKQTTEIALININP